MVNNPSPNLKLKIMEEHTVLHYMIVYVVIRSQLIYFHHLPMPFFNTSQKPWFPWGCLIIGGWDQWLIMVTGYPAGVRPAKEIFEIKDDTLWIHVCMHTNMHYMIHNWTNYLFWPKELPCCTLQCGIWWFNETCLTSFI